MIRSILSSLVVLFCLSSCNEQNTNASKEEWQTLFNGKDFTGWDIKIAKHELNDNYQGNFFVEDSILKVAYKGWAKFDGEFGHIYYKEPFSYYILEMEYRFTGTQLQGGPGYAYLNSGVMLHSQSAASLGKEQTFPVSLEMQFLASDSTKQQPHTGNLCTPGTQVFMQGQLSTDHCVDSRSKSYNSDRWVKATAVVLGDSVIHHIIEGDTVLSYQHAQIGGGFVNDGFTWKTGGFGADSADWIKKEGIPLKEGYIALQAESHPVEFRNIRLLNLKGCMDKKATNYKSYYVAADNSKCKYE